LTEPWREQGQLFQYPLPGDPPLTGELAVSIECISPYDGSTQWKVQGYGGSESLLILEGEGFLWNWKPSCEPGSLIRVTVENPLNTPRAFFIVCKFQAGEYDLVVVRG